jgi:hypothetical protein
MVKNNASTSYDVTDKSITPLVRVGCCRQGGPASRVGRPR